MGTNKKTKLNEIPKENPFKVPDNYFEDFASRMQEQIAEENKVVPLFQKMRPFLYVAASVIVILSVTFVAFTGDTQEDDMMAKQNADTVQVTETSNKEMAVSKKSDEVLFDDIDDEEMFDELYYEFYDDI
jgi:esterase/lipase